MDDPYLQLLAATVLFSSSSLRSVFETVIRQRHPSRRREIVLVVGASCRKVFFLDVIITPAHSISYNIKV